ncbi:MAG: MlaD family protein [Puniceicoccales bacterium]|jgi:paraquat-inducible protein B|nr:MlaD family protein [Puniceicoccales bacterium]
MSRQVSNSLIGVFVLGGAALVVLCIGLFGAGRFNSQKTAYICYFEDSVNGLAVGSPVKFKGVSIGKVSRVLLHTPSQEESGNTVPVIIEIDERTPVTPELSALLRETSRNGRGAKRDLRARLQQQSIVTGLLYVELDFHPGSPARFCQKANNAGNTPELPTLPSNLGALVKATTRTLDQFSRIQFAEMGEKLNRVLTRLEMAVAAIDFKGINQGVLDVTAAANEILRDPEVRRLPANVNTSLQAVHNLAQKLESLAGPIADDTHKIAEDARAALAQINRAAANLRRLTQPGSSVHGSIDETLREVTDAARALRLLAESLERHPESLIGGKKERPPVPREK